MDSKCPLITQPTDSNLILSNYSITQGTVVQVGCRQFGRRLTSGPPLLICQSPPTWTPTLTSFTCEYNGTFNTYERLIIGLASAAAGALVFGFLLICCLAAIYKDKRKDENEVDSYPPSAINEKVGYTQYSNGFGDGGYGGGGSGGSGGGGIRGYRPSGKYEKQIIPEPQYDSRNDPLKRDPILWSAYNTSTLRETERPDQTSGYQFYSGKNSSAQYDNRAFDRNEYGRSSGYRDTGYHGTNYQQGKREDYRWNGQLPRAQVPRDDRNNKQY